MKTVKDLPGPSLLGLLAFVKSVKHDGTDVAFSRLQQQYGDQVFLPLVKRLVIFNALDIQYIFKDNKLNFIKSPTIEFVKGFLGDGVATSEGELWKRQRLVVGREFRSASIRGYLPVMQRAIHELLEKWGSSDGQYDVAEEMSDLTFAIASQVFFGVCSSTQTQKMKQAFIECGEAAVARGRRLIKLPAFMLKQQIKREKEALETLDEIVFSIINEHKQSEAEDVNVMSRLLAYRDEESGEGLSDKQLRDEVITMVAGGFETTSNALTWTLHLLSHNPDCLDKIHKELDDVLQGRTADFSDIQKLSYLTQSFMEAMRLFPPFPVLSRQNIKVDQLRGLNIKPGQHIYMLPVITHRDARYFPEPMAFKPERFADQNDLNKDGISYFPFGEGMRKCIGKNMAMVEGILILSMLLQRFDIEPVPGFSPKPQFSITMFPEQGLPLQIKQRKL